MRKGVQEQVPHAWPATGRQPSVRAPLVMGASKSVDESGHPALRSLKTRGLSRVQLVISDDHAGLKNAIARVLLGRPGSAAACTSCATRSRMRAKVSGRWCWR